MQQLVTDEGSVQVVQGIKEDINIYAKAGLWRPCVTLVIMLIKS
jgi:hypothetical protein